MSEQRDIDLRVIVDPSERRTTFVTVQDVEPIIEQNKILQTLEQTNTDGLKHLAHIPANIINQWLNEEWARGSNIRIWDEEFEFLLAKKLADPDNAKLLVSGPSFKTGFRS